MGGVAGGAVYGLATTVTVLLMAAPIGWAAALVIGLGSVAAGYAGGSIAKNIYDTYGNKYDLTSGLGVSQLCK